MKLIDRFLSRELLVNVAFAIALEIALVLVRFTHVACFVVQRESLNC